MINKKKILVFPCGSEIGLEIYRSLNCSTYFELYGASSIEDHASFVYENYISNLPFVDEENFIQKINEIIDKYQIDFIFPAHDSVVLKLAQNENKIHCKILLSPLKTCEICRSKYQTYKYFKDIIPVPKIHTIKTIPGYPVFLKPDIGQGAKGCSKANSYSEVLAALEKDNSLLILEYLPGKEYTIDCFSDNEGKLLYCQGRERARIMNGISVNTYPVSDKKFYELANIINNKLEFKGAWFFQLKKDINAQYCLLEISPRIAGTMELNRMQGVNIPLMWCFSASGYPVKIIKNEYNIKMDRALENKFKIDVEYDTIYIDFDDCITKNKMVNHKIIAFLYAAINKKKKIILLTKHDGNIYEALSSYRLSNIFDEIIHIKQDEDKYRYITCKNSIFIDDSFKERYDVYSHNNIYVFSPDMIESLI